VTTAWYFAYGSNMQSATLRGRRGIQFHRALPARAPGWRLVLDKPPLFSTGNSFANIVPDPAAETFGVAFEVAEDDLNHIDLTEGVLIGNYERVATTVLPLHTPQGAPTDALTAFTLSSERRDPMLQPSTRYMSLLIEGAIEHRLPDNYVAFLRTIPTCAESEELQRLRPMIDEAMRSLRR
jgi:hypothetical protein